MNQRKDFGYVPCDAITKIFRPIILVAFFLIQKEAYIGLLKHNCNQKRHCLSLHTAAY